MKMDDIKNSIGPIVLDMENPNIKKPGQIVLENAKFEIIPNFVDYLKSGLEINMIAAIDFTGISLDLFRFERHPNSANLVTLLK